MTAIVLNGHTYNSADMVGYGYLAAHPVTGLQYFPDSIFTDFLVALSQGAVIKTAPAIAAGVLTLAMASSNIFRVTLNANVTTLTLNMSGVTSNVATFQLILDITGSFTIAWPASVKWANGAAPILTTTNGKVDIFTFVTTDGGTTWYGFKAGQNF